MLLSTHVCKHFFCRQQKLFQARKEANATYVRVFKEILTIIAYIEAGA